jgi:uncharacterized membrane-anchored protein
VQQSALARARRSHDGRERPALEPEADPVQRDDRRVALAMDLADIAEGESGSGDRRFGDVRDEGVH